MTAIDELTTGDRETVKAIYRLAPAAGEVARTGELAAALDVTPASATARVQRLAEQGVAFYTPYQGVELTPVGRRVAARAIRRHRIVERFLSDQLGFPWQAADRLAVTFEHALPTEVITRMNETLDRPATCPHGFPIPAADATDVPTLPTLDQIEPGVTAHVALEGHIDDDVRDFLASLGVRPEARIAVQQRHPLAGPVEVTVDGREHMIGNRVARQIYVRT